MSPAAETLWAEGHSPLTNTALEAAGCEERVRRLGKKGRILRRTGENARGRCGREPTSQERVRISYRRRGPKPKAAAMSVAAWLWCVDSAAAMPLPMGG